MKRIACISTMATTDGNPESPTHLMELYNSTRVYNREHDITGLFLVSNKLCLQVMEGNSKSLANAIYKMSRDDRSEDFSILMNCDVEKPLFTRWTIRFLDGRSDSHHEFLEKIKPVIIDKLEPKSDLDKSRIREFFKKAPTKAENGSASVTNTERTENTEQTTSTPKEKRQDYDGLVVSISSWPRPTQLRMTPEVIKLCSSISQRPTHFERLSALNIFSSDEALKQTLALLEQIGLLNKHASSPVPDVGALNESTGNVEHRKRDRFSSVLKRFITAART